jgi:hypothetical protein
LDEVVMEFADLAEAEIANSSLRGANLVGADLSGTSATASSFAGADLFRTNMAEFEPRGCNPHPILPTEPPPPKFQSTDAAMPDVPESPLSRAPSTEADRHAWMSRLKTANSRKSAKE